MELAAAAERGQPYSQPYSPCPQQQALTEQDMKEEEERQQQVDEEDQDMLDMEMAEMLARET